MAKRQYSILEQVRAYQRRGKRETEEQWRDRIVHMRDHLMAQVAKLEKIADLDSLVFPRAATKEEIDQWHNLYASCLRFIEERHRAGDSESMTLFAFSTALHDYAKSELAEKIDNAREEAERVKSAAAGK